ncbi:hypothetical protein EDB84DRAFT_1682151 [Lactarius hengduanensis]|nr:hypothetical protein EDB84DRAFT_1682151 [Lactarius hengduanensis]
MILEAVPNDAISLDLRIASMSHILNPTIRQRRCTSRLAAHRGPSRYLSLDLSVPPAYPAPSTLCPPTQMQAIAPSSAQAPPTYKSSNTRQASDSAYSRVPPAHAGSASEPEWTALFPARGHAHAPPPAASRKNNNHKGSDANAGEGAGRGNGERKRAVPWHLTPYHPAIAFYISIRIWTLALVSTPKYVLFYHQVPRAQGRQRKLKADMVNVPRVVPKKDDGDDEGEGEGDDEETVEPELKRHPLRSGRGTEDVAC